MRLVRVRSLRIKFIVLLLAVSAVALSSAFLLRDLMLRDFREYLEGEREDRVYWVTADLERSFELHRRWDRKTLADETVRALLLGFEVRVLDQDGSPVMDTKTALASLSPLVRRRVTALSRLLLPEEEGMPARPYPLFLAGNEIGVLEVRFLPPERDILYVRQSKNFLLWSLVATGTVAVVLSIAASGVLTRSVKRLASAAAAVGAGDLSARVPETGGDEIGSLSASFNRMARALETQETLRKKLITNLAHELRTPLGVMRGELEGMMDGVIPMTRGQIESLREETGRLQHLLEGIEDLAQAQASGLVLRKQAVLLRPFLENILGRMALPAKEKGVSLRLDCGESVSVEADPERLSQIVINLLNNALKATAREGIVTVRAFPEGGATVLQIVDTGSGIAAADLPHIFERFYRSAEGGLGLGLAIVKELVEAHGGAVRAESEQGKGAVFTVVLPGRGVHNSS